METRETSSVCRKFFEKFPLGKERVHVELVKFLINHPSSRSKLQEWLKSSEQEPQPGPETNTESLPGNSESNQTGKNAYDDTVSKRGRENDTDDEDQGVPRPHSTAFTKCDIRSKSERDIGNEMYKKKDLWKCLRHYNLAVRYACFPSSTAKCNEDVDSSKKTSCNEDDGSRENCLAIALANRSAVHAELGEPFYEKSVKDIDLALQYGLPGKIKSKLLLRKTTILAKQENWKSAEESLKILKAFVQQGQPNETPAQQHTMDKKIYELESLVKQNLPMYLLVEEHPLAFEKRLMEYKAFTNNENFENASDLVSLQISESLGRHVIASKDIQDETELFNEFPFASVLLPEFYETHCHHCHKSLKQFNSPEIYFFPCRRCTQVLFCSDLCASTAKCYHRHECGWLELLHSVGIAHLAVRIVLVAGVDKILNCTSNNSNLTDMKNLEIFRTGMDNYQRVYSLMDHIDDMFEEDLFQYTLTASLLTQFLIQRTSFLKHLPEEQHLRIGGTLLRHICQLICNAHAITDILPDDDIPMFVVDEYQKRVATAIFPAASIMNHSCDPNIIFHFKRGNLLIVKAGRNIRRGENVYNCYGPHYRRMPYNERQEILKQQYFFDCNCEKCLEEQQGVSFVGRFQALKCDKCSCPIFLSSDSTVMPCKHCGNILNMEKTNYLLEKIYTLQSEGDDLLQQGRIQEARKSLRACYKSAVQVLYKHNESFGKLCDSLAKCHLLLGERGDALGRLNESLDYVKARFGKTSLEYIKEIRKIQEAGESGTILRTEEPITES